MTSAIQLSFLGLEKQKLLPRLPEGLKRSRTPPPLTRQFEMSLKGRPKAVERNKATLFKADIIK